MWHYRGTPHYLEQQGQRLGVARVLVDRARQNPEIYRASVLLGQLCERYHRAPRDEAGVSLIAGPELAQVRGTLHQCEQELEKLHALAAASQAMVDDAYAAFGLSAPDRAFRVACDHDDPEPASGPDARPVRIRPGGPRQADGRKLQGAEQRPRAAE